MKVRLSVDLPEITPEIFTSGSAIIGIRGSGKTNDGVVLAEQAVAHGVPVVAIDPTGVWYGIKSSADGKFPGLPFYVFGGQHGDVPLEPSAGPIIARFVVDERVPIILDLSDMSKRMQRKFVGEFCEALYDLKARKRDPLLVIIDEVARFCPQTMPKGALDLATCVGAVEDIVALGRSRGLGCAIIGQRPATINNNVLTQADNLFAMRTVGTADRKAIDAWVTEAQGDQEQRNELVQNIASLPQGEGYFWSPALFGVFRRVKFAPRTTFDSSRTPKVGEKRIEPIAFAKVDLDALRGEIARSVEAAKADDPKELRKQIADLRKQLDSADARGADAIVEKRTEVPVLTDEQMRAVHELASALKGWGEHLQRFFAESSAPLVARMERCAADISAAIQRSESHSAPVTKRAAPAAMKSAPVARRVDNEPNGMPAGCRRILAVLKAYGGTLAKGDLATLSDVQIRNGTLGKYLAELSSRGLIESDRNSVTITSAGIAQADTIAPLSATDVFALYESKLGRGERDILRYAVERRGEPCEKGTVSAATDVAIRNGTFGKYARRLENFGLVENDRNTIRASRAIFLGESIA